MSTTEITIDERNTKLKYFITCLKCEVSGKVCDDCPVQYEAGNMGEIIENLEAISKALEQEPKTGHWIKKEDDTCWWYVCSECEQEPLKNRWNDDDVLSTFCPNCGAKMIEPQERRGVIDLPLDFY